MGPPIEIPAGLSLETDVSIADWVDERLMPFRAGGDRVLVGEVVPTGFETYARILHPARRRTPDGGEGEPVTWAEVALERDKRIHPEVQFPALIGAPLDHRMTETDELWMPSEGSIPPELCDPLVEVLGRHTATAERCLFCIWEGFGILAREGAGWSLLVAVGPGLRGRIRRRGMRLAALHRARTESAQRERTPAVRIHASLDGRSAFRAYYLLRGPLRSLADFRFAGSNYQSPNIWWPEDRAWVVATEIDDWTTYVGGTRACIDDLLASRELEAVPSDTAFRFDLLGDRINAPDGL